MLPNRVHFLLQGFLSKLDQSAIASAILQARNKLPVTVDVMRIMHTADSNLAKLKVHSASLQVHASASYNSCVKNI